MLRLPQPLTDEAQQGVSFAFPVIVARGAWVCQCRRENDEVTRSNNYPELMIRTSGAHIVDDHRGSFASIGRARKRCRGGQLRKAARPGAVWFARGPVAIRGGTLNSACVTIANSNGERRPPAGAWQVRVGRTAPGKSSRTNQRVTNPVLRRCWSGTARAVRCTSGARDDRGSGKCCEAQSALPCCTGETTHPPIAETTQSRASPGPQPHGGTGSREQSAPARHLDGMGIAQTWSARGDGDDNRAEPTTTGQNRRQPGRTKAELEHDMHRRLLLGGTFLSLAGAARAEAAWTLVTPDEVMRDRSAPHTPTMHTRGLPQPGAPEIVVDQPAAAATLHPPLNIRVRFVPAAGTAINTSSFRATYGFLGIDITSRLLQHAQLDNQQLRADNVAIPAGDHKVTLTIADLQGRESSRTFQFTVA
jgi:hypothetical protein